MGKPAIFEHILRTCVESGALLGDRIRMNAIHSPRVYMRSLATRHSRSELSPAIRDAISVVKAAGFDLVIVETSGIGQGDAAITEVCDVSMYVMTSEFGAPTQLEKIDMTDYADLIAINKFERKGSEDAKRQVQKQYQRSHQLFDRDLSEMPVYGTIASQFNDPGTNTLFVALVDTSNRKTGTNWKTNLKTVANVEKHNVIIPNERRYYLREIAETVRSYHRRAEQQVEVARRLFQIEGAIEAAKERDEAEDVIRALETLKADYEAKLTPESKRILATWEETKAKYAAKTFVTKVRDKEIVTEPLFCFFRQICSINPDNLFIMNGMYSTCIHLFHYIEGEC
ncbi:hypothetical protein AP057_01920 [Geobacillus sp. Sah69]|nr:hypothetical protein AP057_01920 [Geobacillus sp. Sah69]